MALSDADLVLKIRQTLRDRDDGFMTDAEVVAHVANVFDGDVEFARGATQPHPELRVCLYVELRK